MDLHPVTAPTVHLRGSGWDWRPWETLLCLLLYAAGGAFGIWLSVTVIGPWFVRLLPSA